MDYPKKLFASVLLLDGKIESWKVVDYPKRTPGMFKAYWKRDRLDDYTAEFKEFVVNSTEENNQVFIEHAPKWFSQWPHAEDYKGEKAHGDES